MLVDSATRCRVPLYKLLSTFSHFLIKHLSLLPPATANTAPELATKYKKGGGGWMERESLLGTVSVFHKVVRASPVTGYLIYLNIRSLLPKY
jgi:hypothetical protein